MRLARFAFLLGALEFLLRALARVHTDWLSDFAAPYVSSTLWLRGANPYNPLKFLSTWQARGGPHLNINDFVSGTHSVYPPPTLLLMAPLALLRWSSAIYVYVFLGLTLYAGAVYGMLRLGWPQHRRLADLAKEPLAVLFAAFALGFAPIHTAFHSLNIVLYAGCGALFAVLIALHRDVASEASEKSGKQRASARAVLLGVCVTVAILLKPTTGVFLLPWLARERRWRLISLVFLACGIITAISLVPLISHLGMSWLTDYRQNITFLFTQGGDADVSPENHDSTDRIDLQLVAFALFGNRTLASAAAGFTYLLLLCLFLKRAGWPRRDSIPAERHGVLHLPLLVAAGCLALGLLPSYTRMYAAVVLLPLILWSFTHLQFRSARWLLLLLSDFLLNTSAVVRRIGDATGAIVASPRLWNFTLGGHTCWILLAIGILLLWAVRQQTGEDILESSSSGQSAVPNPLR